jgi:hypothetical protein
MAVNIIGGQPNVATAIQTIPFNELGINSTNTAIIYVIGSALKSYMPGRGINGITGFEIGKGYYIIAKQDIDLESVLVPPIPETAAATLSNSETFTI